ncbi:hypothetical protein P4O66_015363, partial [Electrophorus voltai]
MLSQGWEVQFVCSWLSVEIKFGMVWDHVCDDKGLWHHIWYS